MQEWVPWASAQWQSDFTPVSYIFRLIWEKISTGSVFKNLLIDREFCENRRGETHTLRKGVNDFNPYFLHFVSPFGWNSVEESCTYCCWACVGLWKSEQEDFSNGCNWSYVYACTVKPYCILKAKNALVQYVYHVTEHTICSLVTETECVYCAIRTESLIQVEFNLQAVSSRKDKNVSNYSCFLSVSVITWF